MVEEFVLDHNKKKYKVIALSELSKYTEQDRIVVYIDTNNIDDINETIDNFALSIQDAGFKGQMIFTFKDLTMSEFVVSQKQTNTEDIGIVENVEGR